MLFVRHHLITNKKTIVRWLLQQSKSCKIELYVFFVGNVMLPESVPLNRHVSKLSPPLYDSIIEQFLLFFAFSARIILRFFRNPVIVNCF